MKKHYFYKALFLCLGLTRPAAGMIRSVETLKKGKKRLVIIQLDDTPLNAVSAKVFQQTVTLNKENYNYSKKAFGKDHNRTYFENFKNFIANQTKHYENEDGTKNKINILFFARSFLNQPDLLPSETFYSLLQKEYFPYPFNRFEQTRSKEWSCEPFQFSLTSIEAGRVGYHMYFVHTKKPKKKNAPHSTVQAYVSPFFSGLHILRKQSIAENKNYAIALTLPFPEIETIGFYRKAVPKIKKAFSKYEKTLHKTTKECLKSSDLLINTIFKRCTHCKDDESMLMILKKIDQEEFREDGRGETVFYKALTNFRYNYLPYRILKSQDNYDTTICFFVCNNNNKNPNLESRRLIKEFGYKPDFKSNLIATHWECIPPYILKTVLNRAIHCCNVCGKNSNQKCPHCQVSYCSRKCQKDDWKEHKKFCKKLESKGPEEDPEQIGDCCNFCKKPANKKCARCKKASYCSRDCQKRDWKKHKKACRKHQ